jgi:hypothetical protein
MLSALAFWLAGAGCLLGCENTTEAAVSHHPIEASPASRAASGDEHECCRMKMTREDGAATGASSLKSLPRPHGLMTCYALGGQMSETARSLRVTQQSLPASRVGATHAPLTTTVERPAHHAQRVPDRGGTHLRCCVFLI